MGVNEGVHAQNGAQGRKAGSQVSRWEDLELQQANPGVLKVGGNEDPG